MRHKWVSWDSEYPYLKKCERCGIGPFRESHVKHGGFGSCKGQPRGEMTNERRRN